MYKPLCIAIIITGNVVICSCSLLDDAVNFYQQHPPSAFNPMVACAVQSHSKLTLQGQGFHRQLHYDISVAVQRTANCSDAAVGGSPHCRERHGPCELVLLQPLSNALYVDPYQLRNEFDGISITGHRVKARQFGEVDTESTQQAASPQLLALQFEIASAATAQPQSCLAAGCCEAHHWDCDPGCERMHLDLPDPKSSTTHEVAALEVEVPVHARYPLPDASGTLGHAVVHATVELCSPSMLWQCNSSCTGGCLWQDTHAEMGLCQVQATWHIPAGRFSHADGIVWLTWLLSIAGFACLLVS